MAETADKSPTLVALEQAIDVAGGQSSLARAISKTQGHISQWLQRGRCAPDSVLAIEAETGVSRHRLRPDVFGSEPATPPKAEERAAAQ